MALRLRSNPVSSGGGALFVSNPRKRKIVRKNRKKVAVRKLKVVRKRKNPAKKRKVVARKNRKNPMRKRRVMRKARKNPMRKRKVMARKNRKNPVRKTRVVRKNPMAFGFLKPVENLVKKIPVIGKKVAPFTQSAFGLMIGAGGVTGAMMGVGHIPVVRDYAKYPFGHAFGFTVMGVGLAVASALLPVKPATKKALALSFAGAGGAINAFQLVMCGFDLQACADQNLTMLGANDQDDALAVDPEVSGLALGDGMYYEVQALSGIAQDMAGIDYQSAELGDAMSCPADLSVDEGQVAIQGREAFMRKFGMPARKMAGARSFQSKMAGQKGHRWGWLIKSLGYERFSKLASMPAKQRKMLIAKLKASAIKASQSTFDQELTGAMQGIAMSGVAMDMSGLVVDNMSGIAIAGAGI